MTEIERAADMIADAVCEALPVMAFTGAGISRESGVPTFRGDHGIWQQNDPEEVATLRGFENDPAKSWRFHEKLRHVCREAAPNPAHLALAWVETAVGDEASVPIVTQNIDGLHQAAGSTNVVELHGSCHRMVCTECDFHTDDLPEQFESLPPICECGALLRPDVVWFGEQLPSDMMAQAQRWARKAGVVLSIGTSATVQPAASLPVMAMRSGGDVVEINPETTPLSPVADIALHGAAGDVLPQLAEALSARLSEACNSGE